MALTSSSAASTRPHITRPQLPVTSGPSLSLTLLQPHTFCPSNTTQGRCCSLSLEFSALRSLWLSLFPRSHLKPHLSERPGLRYLSSPCQHSPHTLVPLCSTTCLIFYITFRSEILLTICERIIVYKIHRTWILSTLLSSVSLVSRTAWARQAQF